MLFLLTRLVHLKNLFLLLMRLVILGLDHTALLLGFRKQRLNVITYRNWNGRNNRAYLFVSLILPFMVMLAKGFLIVSHCSKCGKVNKRISTCGVGWDYLWLKFVMEDILMVPLDHFMFYYHFSLVIPFKHLPELGFFFPPPHPIWWAEVKKNADFINFQCSWKPVAIILESQPRGSSPYLLFKMV